MKNKINTDNKNRIYYLDVLKIISCFSVIILHTSAEKFYEYSPQTYEWQIFNFYDSCVRFSVPVFIMVSGALFLGKKDINLKTLYKKNILRLLIAYIIYTIFYSTFNLYITNSNINIKTIIKNSLLSSNYHLWFIPMIIEIYILTPIIKKIISKSTQKEIQYILIIFFLFCILPNIIKQFQYPYSDYLKSILNRFSIGTTISYVGYFILGYYIDTYKISKSKRIKLYILGISSLIICILGNSLYSIKLNTATTNFYGNFFVTTFFISIALFIFIKYTISNIKIKNNISKIIINISNASFGIYLIHVFIIRTIIDLLKFNVTTINPLYSIPLISISVFIFSLIIINFLQKIPYINKFIT